MRSARAGPGGPATSSVKSATVAPLRASFPVPEGANTAGRVIVRELYHRTDAAMLDAILASAASGELVIPISYTFTLDQIGLAQNAVAAGAPGKVVLKH